MMAKDKLRKADFFSGAAVLLVGLFIIGQGVRMPMKDSWGGVQNVWFVSPALFPLFVGAMLSLLGLILMRTALQAIGREGLAEVFRYLLSGELRHFLRQEGTIRFYGTVVNLVIFVFLLVPRVDFFLASTLFLLSFFFMYYCGSLLFINRMILFSLGWALLLGLIHASGLSAAAGSMLAYPLDWLSLVWVMSLVFYARKCLTLADDIRRKYRISLLVGLAAPLTVGIVFKYFLLVPLPCEGLVVQVLDAVWYADLWS